MKPWTTWTEYWFRPSPLLDLALLRVFAVGFQLWYLAAMEHRHALAEVAGLPDALYRPLPVLRLLTLPLGLNYRVSHEALDTVYWLTLAVGVLALFGLWTNASVALFTLGNIFLVSFQFSFHYIGHRIAVMVIALALLAFSPCSRALSVDHLRRRLRRASITRHLEAPRLLEQVDPFALWPVLLVRWMLALVYLSAATSKLHASGLDWMNGYTLQYYMLQDGLRHDVALGVWFGQHHAIAWLLSWGAILFEGTFCLTLIVPALALLYVPIGVAFHLAIYLIQRADFWEFIVLYAAFVPWTTLIVWVSSGRGATAAPQTSPTGPDSFTGTARCASAR